MPALNQVTANLAAEQAQGNYSPVKASQTYGFSARTISGSYRVSLHGHGVALDINALPTNIVLDHDGLAVQVYRGYSPAVPEYIRRLVRGTDESDREHSG